MGSRGNEYPGSGNPGIGRSSTPRPQHQFRSMTASATPSPGQSQEQQHPQSATRGDQLLAEYMRLRQENQRTGYTGPTILRRQASTGDQGPAARSPASSGGGEQGPPPFRVHASSGPDHGARSERHNVRIRWIGQAQPDPENRFSPRDTGMEQFGVVAAAAVLAHPGGAQGASQGQGPRASGNQANRNSNSNETPPSTQIEDGVLESIREIRSNYVFQYMPAIQLDLNEHFGLNNPNVVSPFNVPVPAPPVARVIPTPAPSAPGGNSAHLASRIRALRLASEEALMRINEQQLPDSDLTSSDADESAPNPYPAPRVLPVPAQSSASHSSGVSASFGPLETETLRLERLSDITDGLRDALQELHSALSGQLEASGIQAMIHLGPNPGTSSAAQRTERGQGPVQPQRDRAPYQPAPAPTPERPDTSDSGYSMEFSVWDAETRVNNLNMFMAESESSEEEFGGQRENQNGYGSVAALQALYYAATRDRGTSMPDANVDMTTLRERARVQGRRPAFQVSRDVSPETREFYQSIGLPVTEGDTSQNRLSGFISMAAPRGWDAEMEELLGKDTPLPLYNPESSNEGNGEIPNQEDEIPNDETPIENNGELSDGEYDETQFNEDSEKTLNEDNSSTETRSSCSSSSSSTSSSSDTESEEVEDIVVPNPAELAMLDNITMSNNVEMQLPVNYEASSIPELAQITQMMRANGANQQTLDRFVRTGVSELTKLASTMMGIPENSRDQHEASNSHWPAVTEFEELLEQIRLNEEFSEEEDSTSTLVPEIAAQSDQENDSVNSNEQENDEIPVIEISQEDIEEIENLPEEFDELETETIVDLLKNLDRKHGHLLRDNKMKADSESSDCQNMFSDSSDHSDSDSSSDDSDFSHDFEDDHDGASKTDSEDEAQHGSQIMFSSAGGGDSDQVDPKMAGTTDRVTDDRTGEPTTAGDTVGNPIRKMIQAECQSITTASRDQGNESKPSVTAHCRLEPAVAQTNQPVLALVPVQELNPLQESQNSVQPTEEKDSGFRALRNKMSTALTNMKNKRKSLPRK